MNTTQIQDLNITCDDPATNAVFNEMITMTGETHDEIKRKRSENRLLVGNYVVFQPNNGEDKIGLILGFSYCTEDYIRHAHLCRLIPDNHGFLCAGNFFILKGKPLNFVCLPLSNSWVFVKKFLQRKSYYSKMDEMNLYITNYAFKQFFNVDLTTVNFPLDDIKKLSQQYIQAFSKDIMSIPDIYHKIFTRFKV
jgi:hypothetical protein